MMFDRGRKNGDQRRPVGHAYTWEGLYYLPFANFQLHFTHVSLWIWSLQKSPSEARTRVIYAAVGRDILTPPTASWYSWRQGAPAGWPANNKTVQSSSRLYCNNATNQHIIACLSVSESDADVYHCMGCWSIETFINCHSKQITLYCYSGPRKNNTWILLSVL